MTLLLYRNVCV